MEGNRGQHTVKGSGYSFKSQHPMAYGIKILSIGLVALLAVSCGGGGGNSPACTAVQYST